MHLYFALWISLINYYIGQGHATWYPEGSPSYQGHLSQVYSVRQEGSSATHDPPGVHQPQGRDGDPQTVGTLYRGGGGWRFQFWFVRETSGDNYPNDDYQINSARDWNSHITEKYGLFYNHCNRSVNVVSWFKCKIKIKQHTSSIEKHFIMDEISECLTE